MAQATKVVRDSAKPPAAGKGRPKGALNKTTALLKDAILKAATDAGNGDLSAYLKEQAEKNPTAFMSLLGKVLPLQVTGEGGRPIKAKVKYVITRPE